MPFMDWKRRKFLFAKIMLPEEILAKEKKYHDLMILANRSSKKDIELEYKHKRDALREILRIYE